MRKKGIEITIVPVNAMGLIIAAVMVLLIAHFTSQVVNAWVGQSGSVNNFDLLVNAVKGLKDGDSRSVVLDLENDLWLFGFGKDKLEVKYTGQDWLGSPTVSKPRTCSLNKACLCLCEKDCKKVIGKCQNFDKISEFIAEDIDEKYSKGRGGYLVINSNGDEIQLDLWRLGEVIRVGKFDAEKENARSEFERFTKFVNGNVGVRYPGVCKLVFKINKDKLKEPYYFVVSKATETTTDSRTGEAKVRIIESATLYFTGTDEVERGLKYEYIPTVPITKTAFDPSNLDKIFDISTSAEYIETESFAISPYRDVGRDEKSIMSDNMVLLQKDDNWMWTWFPEGFDDSLITECGDEGAGGGSRSFG